MAPSRFLPAGWAWLRRRPRASEAAFILVAVVVGAAAGAGSVLIGSVARTLQHLLFGLPPTVRLSSLPSLGWPALAVLPIGGGVLALFSLATRARQRRLVDAVEANALHGGGCRWSTAW